MPPTIDKDVSWSKTKFEHETKIEFENLTKYNIMKSDDLSLLSLIILSPSIEDSSLYSVTVVHETGAVNLSFQLEVLGMHTYSLVPRLPYSDLFGVQH